MDLGAAAFFTVVEVAGGDGGMEHFLQAHRLGAELDLIGTVAFGFAAFVFHGSNRAVGMKLDDIALAADAETHRADAEIARDAHTVADFRWTVVSAFMKGTALSGEFVFSPHLFQMDEGALARTEKPVLEGRNGDGIFFGGHGWLFDLRGKIRPLGVGWLAGGEAKIAS